MAAFSAAWQGEIDLLPNVTNLQSHSGSQITAFAMTLGNQWVAQDAASGALPTLYAAVADVPGDSFAGPSGRLSLGMRGAPALGHRSARARDTEVGRRLWAASETLTGVSFPDMQVKTTTD
jgi:hypothetical protein